MKRGVVSQGVRRTRGIIDLSHEPDQPESFKPPDDIRGLCPDGEVLAEQDARVDGR